MNSNNDAVFWTYLAGLSGAEQEHFDLVLCEQAVALELALNLVIACCV
jgi:hypothetical protein